MPTEETWSFRVSGIKYILNGRRVYHYAVSEDEIHRRSIDERKQCQHDATNHPQQKHHDAGHHEVEHQHDDSYRNQQK